MKKNYKAISGIFPMPVLMIATYNEDGSIDVMNAAWGMAQSMKHLKLCLSNSHKTYKNLKRIMECTVSLATKDTITESDYFGIVSANTSKDKFEKSKMKAIKSENVNAPVIEEYPVCMECKVVDFENDGVLVEVMNTLINEEYLTQEGNVDFEKMGIIAFDPYGHGYYLVEKKVADAFSVGNKLK